MKSTRLSTITRFGMVAVLAATALLSVAHAQSIPTAQSTPTAPRLPDLSNLQAGNGGSLSTENGIREPLPIGWNYIHAANCEVFYSGGSPYFYVWDTGGGTYFYTTDTNFKQLISPACQTGNFLAFYVYDSSNHWNYVYSYNYK
jgi:hypothetical protein